MQLLGFLLFAAIIYCGFGIAINYIMFKNKGNDSSEFQINWNETLTWPKYMF